MLHQTTFLTIYILMITFILGCALGSFTDCLAGRMLNGTSVLKGRSHCDACGHVLGVLDLVPLFSRLCLRGRCRYCGAKIPAEAFWTELVSGIACCLIMYRYDVSVLALRGILLFMSDTHRSACVDHTGPASDSRNPDLFRHGAGLTGTGKTDAAGSSDRCRTGCQYAGTFPAV